LKHEIDISFTVATFAHFQLGLGPCCFSRRLDFKHRFVAKWQPGLHGLVSRWSKIHLPWWHHQLGARSHWLRCFALEQSDLLPQLGSPMCCLWPLTAFRWIRSWPNRTTYLWAL